MKFLPSQLMYFLQNRETTKKIRSLIKFIAILGFLVITFGILFHFLMEYEDRKFSWLTGLYWTLTVMSTLGFGNITFTSNLGKIFSLIVLLSGIILLLIMLPFTFITFFTPPGWKRSQSSERPGNCRKFLPAMSYSPVLIL